MRRRRLRSSFFVEKSLPFLDSESSETPKVAACDLTIKEMVRGFVFFSIPVASKENDRESDRPYSSTPIPSTDQNDQSDTVTYYDE